MTLREVLISSSAVHLASQSQAVRSVQQNASSTKVAQQVQHVQLPALADHPAAGTPPEGLQTGALQTYQHELQYLPVL
ncbi:hypothetical protein WJX74_007488 [Apatococcus lobatus]|uniref:Uncharacterized protein n=1 Tax=Apatococcus lobatus TaxID=904363 RepID=A0AAW1QTH9_9CHLO